VERVYEGLQAGRAYHTESLNAPAASDTSEVTLADTLGEEDERLAGIGRERAQRGPQKTKGKRGRRNEKKCEKDEIRRDRLGGTKGRNKRR